MKKPLHPFKLIFWRILWLTIPDWLGTIIYRLTGYVFGMIVDCDSGKPIRFYFERRKPEKFSIETWPDK